MIKLFIARLPYTLTSKMLTDMFSPFGQVSSAQISTVGVSSESLGCGYVEMEDVFDAQTAIQKLNGSTLGGKIIGVSIANLSRKFRSNKI